MYNKNITIVKVTVSNKKDNKFIKKMGYKTIGKRYIISRKRGSKKKI